jgi:hypothetical protein
MPPNPVCCILPGFMKPEEEANWHKLEFVFDIFCRTHEKVKIVANILFTIKIYMSCCFQ